MSARWRITGTEQRVSLTSRGDFEDRRLVHFEVLDTGETGSVEISLRNFTDDYVREQVSAYADRLLAISRLSGE